MVEESSVEDSVLCSSVSGSCTKVEQEKVRIASSKIKARRLFFYKCIVFSKIDRFCEGFHIM